MQLSVSERPGITPHFKRINLKAVRHPYGTLINYIFFLRIEVLKVNHINVGGIIQLTHRDKRKQNITEFSSSQQFTKEQRKINRVFKRSST